MSDRTDLERARREAINKGDREAADYFASKIRSTYSGDEYSRPVEAGRALTQGVTFGSGDEIGSGIAAAGVVATTDKTMSDLPSIYNEMMSDQQSKRAAYRDDRPWESGLTEVAGGIGTGVAIGQGIASTQVGQRLMTNTPKWAQASALGGTEGAVYGGMSANPGERMMGAGVGGLVGAIAAPVIGYAADKVGSTLGAIGRWAKNKLTDTPRNEAIRAIRTALLAEGLDADEAVTIYNRIGPDAVMADIGENFRAAARAGVDVPGPAKAQARNILDARQMGQQGRLLGAAEKAVGQNADDLTSTVAAIAKRRAAQADPAYKAAFAAGEDISSETLQSILQRPSMATALRKAQKIAGDYGDTFDPGSLKHLHYAKMALDEMNKQQKFPRHLQQLKTEFLKELDTASPAYKAARAQFAGESELLDAAQAGRVFLKTAPDELKGLVDAMTPGEKDLFKMGAMSGIQDLFDDTRLTHDAAAKLIGKPATLKRLASVFGDEVSAKSFLSAAWKEAEMGRTRAVLTGGSPTAERLAGQKWLEDAIQPEDLGTFLSGNPLGMAMAAAKEVLGKKPLSQAALSEMSGMLLKQGMPEAEVRKILTSPKTMQILANMNQEFITRAGAAGGSIPLLKTQEQ